MIHRVVTMLRSWGFHLLFVWSFLFAGIATLGWGIWNSLEAFSSRSWPEAVGKVTFSTVASYESDSDSGTTTMFYPDIRYNYSVKAKNLPETKSIWANIRVQMWDTHKKSPRGTRWANLFAYIMTRRTREQPSWSPGSLVGCGYLWSLAACFP